MKLATLFVGNDSGPMHMAASVGVPCVVAFSARDYPVKWYPSGSKNVIFRKDVACSPCINEVCTNNNLCLDLISIDELWSGVSKFLIRRD
jgi:ADP-heptose:LPS heptosyltransferase